MSVHAANILCSKGFYDEVASPLLSEVHFKYPENTVNSLTGSHFKQLFNGSEIVVAGRLNDIEMNDFPVEVFAQGVRRQQTSADSMASSLNSHFTHFNPIILVKTGLLSFKLILCSLVLFHQGEKDFMVKGQASAQKWDTIFPDQDYIFGDFTERLWAYLTIQQLLEKK